MSHPFGDRVTQHLSHKHGLSLNTLAAGIGLYPAMIGGMCNGRWLSGLRALLSEPAPAAAPVPPARASRRARKNSPLPVLALNALLILAIVGLFMLRQRATRVTLWEETFDPLHADLWQDARASAVWEDLPGPGAILRENHPQADSGTVASAPFDLDASAYPVLIVSVRDVEPGASYTIQILSLPGDTPVDVLQEATRPGERAIDLVQAVGRQGSLNCTIHVWVNGESRAVTFERIAIVAGRADARDPSQ